MTSHHPHDDLLLSYTAGSLGESWSLAIATHLALCPECRANVTVAEELGGVILENCDPVSMSNSALHNILSELVPPLVGDNSHELKSVSFFPRPLDRYVGVSLQDVNWSSIGGGVRQLILETKDNDTARLLKIPAGSAVPEHGHRGRELTLVLSGSFSDDNGTFFAGDIQDVDEEVRHKPFVGAEAECICLVVTDAALDFKDIIPRMVQPFINI
jgi:putative transcriptional regulator